MKYSRELFCDLKYKNSNGEEEIFCLRDDTSNYPIVDFYNQVGGKGRFLLLGQGGSGKSTTIEILRLHCLKEQITYYYFNLKDIHNIKAINSVKRETKCLIEKIKEIPDSNNKIAVIFDSYDEIPVELITNVNRVLIDLYKSEISFFILGSRTIPEFLRFQILSIIPYSKEKIETVFGERLKGKWLYELLITPFFMKMYLNISSNFCFDNNIKNETDLISKYLIKLCEAKKKDEIGIGILNDSHFAEVSAKLFYFIRFIGQIAYSVAKNEDIGFVNSVCEGDENVKFALNGIIGINDTVSLTENFSLVFSHAKYESFCIAYYLYTESLADYDNFIKLIDCYVQREALYYVGQLIYNYDASEIKEKIKFSSGLNITDKLYENLLFISLGFADSVLSDENIYIRKNFGKFAKRVNFFSNNFYVLEIKSKNITNFRDVNFNNCLFKIVLDDMKTIRKGAFENCLGIKEVEIGDSVKFINERAFMLCANLEEINIGASVKRIAQPTSFFRCSSLKKIKVDVENKYFIGKSNCVVKRANGELVLGCLNSNIDKDLVKSIGRGAFDGKNLGDKIISIPYDIRIDTDEWRKVIFMDSDAISEFYGCGCRALFYPDSQIICKNLRDTKRFRSSESDGEKYNFLSSFSKSRMSYFEKRTDSHFAKLDYIEKYYANFVEMQNRNDDMDSFFDFVHQNVPNKVIVNRLIMVHDRYLLKKNNSMTKAISEKNKEIEYRDVDISLVQEYLILNKKSRKYFKLNERKRDDIISLSVRRHYKLKIVQNIKAYKAFKALRGFQKWLLENKGIKMYFFYDI